MAEPKRLVIRFMAAVDEKSVATLLTTFESKLRDGVNDFTILMSTPGGSVFHGLSAYNFLKGLPVKIATHNFGSVDSIGVVLFCAGAERRSVPQARFLLHGVSVGMQKDQRFEEKQLEETLKSLRIDLTNIARVVAANAGRTEKEVYDAMVERTTLDPEQAKAWGLVHKVEAELIVGDEELIAIP